MQLTAAKNWIYVYKTINLYTCYVTLQLNAALSRNTVSATCENKIIVV